MAIRYLNKEAGANPDDLKVLLGAPTGKAAFLIGVNTLHPLFQKKMECFMWTVLDLVSDKVEKTLFVLC
jgi:hypothetical protein